MQGGQRWTLLSFAEDGTSDLQPQHPGCQSHVQFGQELLTESCLDSVLWFPRNKSSISYLSIHFAPS